MLNLKYTSPSCDASGYGASSRADINALYVAGANITTETIQQTQFRSTYDIQEKVVKYLEGRNIDYKIKILHITPDLYQRYMEPGKYHIGRLVWETDKLPESWIAPINKIDEIWTTTEPHAEIMRKSGVIVPIYTFPEPMEVREEKIIPFKTKDKKDFIFYSIFQWIDRKNPRGLLRAYWKAFENRDDVTLIIKTYRVTYDPSEFKIIENDIETWRKELNLKGKYPKVWLVEKLMTSSEVKKLHALGDCFVNPSSGEGWCRPMAEAMLQGKPVISGDNGGVTDLSPYYLKVSTKASQVTAQTFIPWYQGNMSWKNLDETELGLAMKSVIDHPSYIERTKHAQDFVLQNFNLQTVGAKMLERLSAI